MSRMKKYMEFNENLDDLRKSWKDFEDQHPWEFDYFYDKITAYRYDQEDRYPNSDGIDYDFSTGYEDEDLKRRNTKITATAHVGGSSGGNCWNDNPSEPFETGDSVEWVDFKNYLEHILVYIFGRNHPFANIDKILENLRNSNIVHEDTYSNNEWYGNYEDFQLYYITVN